MGNLGCLVLSLGLAAQERTFTPRAMSLSHTVRVPSRIVVVKRHPLLARAIMETCLEESPTALVTHHPSSRGALRDMRSSPVSLLVCGLNLADYDGLDLLAVVANEQLAAGLMVVSDRKDERALDLLLRRDVRSVMVDAESLDRSELRYALSLARLGGRHVSETIREAWMRTRNACDAYGPLLTDAEQDVLSLTAVWADDDRVAAKRCTSPATIQTQRKRIMRKLDLHSQAQLVAYAARRGMVRFEADRVLRPGFEWRELAGVCNG